MEGHWRHADQVDTNAAYGHVFAAAGHHARGHFGQVKGVFNIGGFEHVGVERGD